MLRAISVRSGGSGDDGAVRDILLLDHAQRRSPGGIFTGLRGTAVEIVLPRGTRLRHDDRLVLEEGGTIGIVARPEPLLEIRSPDLAALARAAWLLGDHHIPVEIHERRLRILRTGSIGELVRALGLAARPIEAPFDPEGGAYDHVNDTGA